MLRSKRNKPMREYRPFQYLNLQRRIANDVYFAGISTWKHPANMQLRSTQIHVIYLTPAWSVEAQLKEEERFC